MIITSACFLLYDYYNNKWRRRKVNISIPAFDKEFVADKDLAEMFVTTNADDDTDVVFIIMRTRTSKHEFASRKYQEELERADGNPKRTNAVLAKILSESLFHGWKNMKDDNNQPVPVSVQNKLAVLEKYPALIGRIISFASNIKNYKEYIAEEGDGDEAVGILDNEVTKEDARGNSENASNGV